VSSPQESSDDGNTHFSETEERDFHVYRDAATELIAAEQ
jgi:hypothetical protein